MKGIGIMKTNGLHVQKTAVSERLAEIELEIAEYQMMIDNAIKTGGKDELKMWRRALATAKKYKVNLKTIPQLQH